MAAGVHLDLLEEIGFSSLEGCCGHFPQVMMEGGGCVPLVLAREETGFSSSESCGHFPQVMMEGIGYIPLVIGCGHLPLRIFFLSFGFLV